MTFLQKFLDFGQVVLCFFFTDEKQIQVRERASYGSQFETNARD